MKKVILWGLAVSVWIGLAMPADSGADEIWEEVSRGNTQISAVLARNGAIYTGAKGGIYVSRDKARSWRNILSLRGDKGRVNLLYADPGDKNSVYAATAGGLYHSVNNGASWKRIYKGRNDRQENCTAVLVCAQGLFLGTDNGIFFSSDQGRSWHKESGKVGDSPILAIASLRDQQGRDEIYAAAGDGVYKLDAAAKIWERIFVPVISDASDNDDAKDENNVAAEEATVERTSNIRWLTSCVGSDPYLYLATSSGAYIGLDKGRSWKALTDFGLLSRNVKYILVTASSEVYAATPSGVFKYTGQRWHELSMLLDVQNPHALAVDEAGDLFAACDNGLFRAQRRNFVVDNAGGRQVACIREPGVEEVQKAAVRYAEVSPEKIKLWRRQAAASGLMPTLSATVNRDAGDLWHWESGSSTRTGDDVLIKGRDTLGWDVRLSWDLGRVIWNPDQTSIDVRSRLTVELRNDILDEVTKIYFERLRLRMELERSRIEDKERRAEKELRIRELTASLDGLTGGFFSQKSAPGHK